MVIEEINKQKKNILKNMLIKVFKGGGFMNDLVSGFGHMHVHT